MYIYIYIYIYIYTYIHIFVYTYIYRAVDGREVTEEAAQYIVNDLNISRI